MTRFDMVFRMMVRFLLLLLFVCSCNSTPKPKDSKILGRLTPQVIYHISVPDNWTEVQGHTRPILDTKQPIAEWSFGEPEQKVNVVLHNFPTEAHAPRIPPIAQVERWKKQFDELEETDATLSPCHFAGYTGLCFQAKGFRDKKPYAVHAYAMQLAPSHFQNLQEASVDAEEMRADVTIKATGSPDSIRKYKQELTRFAESFRLKQEIPW